MKRILFILVLLVSFLQLTKSQVIRLENGVAVSHIKDYASKDIYSYQGAIGIDYLDMGRFYLSSNVGYYRAGGKDKIYLYEDSEWVGQPFTQNLYIDYLTLNTTINVKGFLSDVFYVYAGAGPRINFKVGESTSNSIKLGEGDGKDINTTPDINKVDFGLKTTIGFQYDMGIIMIGLNANYLPSFTKTFKGFEGRKSFGRSSAFSFGLSLGYKI